MFFPKTKVKNAVRAGDLAQLKDLLDAKPKLLDKIYNWSGGIGRLLNMAAYFNQPDIIEYLVKEKHADINRGNGYKSGSTPLHHAQMNNAGQAAIKLLQLGADPSTPNANGLTTIGYAREVHEKDPAVQEQRRQERQAKQEELRKAEQLRREREAAEKLEFVAGKWTLTGGREVTHEYDLPDGSHRLKDIFNFQTRMWRAVVTDLKTSAIAQSIIFFDSMPDAAILQEPLQKLKELGGTVDENTLPASALPKKALKPAATP